MLAIELPQLTRTLTNHTHSTGGIIALGLVANDWTVKECTERFQDLCKKAFTARAFSNLPGFGLLIEMSYHSRYETAPLQEALIEAYKEGYLFGGQRECMSAKSTGLKVAVTSTSASGTPIVLANYNRPCEAKCM